MFSCRPPRLIGLAPWIFVAAGCTSMVDHFSGCREACEILAIGEPATAKIVRLIDTGTTICVELEKHAVTFAVAEQ